MSEKESGRRYDYKFEYEGEKVHVGAHTVVSNEGVVNQYIRWEIGEWNGEYGSIEARRGGPYLVFREDSRTYSTTISDSTAAGIEIPRDIFRQLIGDHEKQLYNVRKA